MIDLRNQPLLPLTRRDVERQRRETMAAIQAEGRGSYHAGAPFGWCPLYRDSDMTVWWQTGWRWAHEEHCRIDAKGAKLRCHDGCRHEEGS